MERELLEWMKGYIEDMEARIDGEWGKCRFVEEIIADGDMPEQYNEICKLLAK